MKLQASPRSVVSRWNRYGSSPLLVLVLVAWGRPADSTTLVTALTSRAEQPRSGGGAQLSGQPKGRGWFDNRHNPSMAPRPRFIHPPRAKSGVRGGAAG